jgi:hypothetical protein
MYGQVIARCYERVATGTCCVGKFLQDVMSRYIATATWCMGKLLQDDMIGIGKLLQDDMSGIGKLLQDVMSGYIPFATCCMGTLLQDFMNWYTVYLLVPDVCASYFKLVYAALLGTNSVLVTSYCN